MTKIWGEAEKKYQNEKGIKKEDRGLYAWALHGFDNDKGGISFRELGYRIGDSILDNLELDDMNENHSHTFGISNSGFIEQFIYATLDMAEQKGKTPVDYFHETRGAIQPLKGIHITYTPKTKNFGIVLPDNSTKIIETDILKDQREWLREYGKAYEVKQLRIKK